MGKYAFQDNSIEIRSAVLSDSSDIERMYRKISIDKRNYRASLSEGDFSKLGGMFQISTLDDIEKRIQNPEEKVIVGSVNGKNVSSLWFGRADKNVFCRIKPDPFYEPIAAVISDKLEKGRLGAFKEIISLRCEASGVMPFLLNLEAAEALKTEGFDDILCEVYEVVGLEDENGFTEHHWLNYASVDTVTSNGGVQIGVSETKQVTIEDFTVHITPHIFLWNTENTISVASDILHRKGCKPVE